MVERRRRDGNFARMTASETAGEVGPFGINLELIPQRRLDGRY